MSVSHPRPLGRRDFLAAGLFGLGHLALPDVLRLRSHAATPMRGRAIIYVYLFGGPSHIDTFDMKPSAPVEYRGEFSPIASNVPGIEFCELLPRLATMADKFTIIRNIKFNPNFHDPVELLSGYRKPAEAGVAIRPDFGSVVSRLQRGSHSELPAYVALDRTVGEEFRNSPAYLGVAHKAFIPGAKLESFALARGITTERLRDRTRLRQELDLLRRDLDTRGDLLGHDDFTGQALDLITSPRAREAFDFQQEPESVRERYGRGDGERLLQARRLVEAGVPVVTLTFGSRGVGECKFSWDTHEGNFRCLKLLLPPLDQALTALFSDLADRGLADDVLVVVGGEMGRTPRVGQSTGNGSKADGRDHWPNVGFSLFSNPGLRMGQIIGQTDKTGSAAIGTPYKPQNLLASVYHFLGIDPATTLPDHQGRPQFLLDDHRRIAEL